MMTFASGSNAQVDAIEKMEINKKAQFSFLRQNLGETIGIKAIKSKTTTRGIDRIITVKTLNGQLKIHIFFIIRFHYA
jgi:hypothetical protein